MNVTFNWFTNPGCAKIMNPLPLTDTYNIRSKISINKCTGYLAENSADFTFLGPERQPFKITFIGQFMAIVHTI